ncbi:Uncharacterised protein [Escherichia coli]|nr:Uncharacterised protein [Escherichia coli]
MYNGNELRIIQSLQKDIEDELNRIGLLYRFFRGQNQKAQ